jgi:hypothetical protein
MSGIACLVRLEARHVKGYLGWKAGSLGSNEASLGCVKGSQALLPLSLHQLIFQAEKRVSYLYNITLCNQHLRHATSHFGRDSDLYGFHCTGSLQQPVLLLS